MAFANVNIGSTASDGTGDPLRTAFDKINKNFAQITIPIVKSPVVSVAGRTGNVTLIYTDVIGAASTASVTAANISLKNYVDEQISSVPAEQKFEIVTDNFNANIGGRYAVDTSTGAVMATLPATPVVGDAIFFVDGFGSFDTNSLIISSNAHNIMGSISQTISIQDQSIGVFFNGIEWRYYS